MKLIKGKDLTPKQTIDVLHAYLYRWTTGNEHRKRVWKDIKGKPTIPLISDHDWLNQHAFWFKNDGTPVKNRRFAVPVSMTKE